MSSCVKLKINSIDMKDYSKELTSEQKTVKAFTDPLNEQIKILIYENEYLKEQLRIASVVDTEGECCESGCDWKHSHTNWWQCNVCKDIQAR